jgi:hypothetical protein
MKLNDIVEIVFKKDYNFQTIRITVEDLLLKTEEDLFEILESTIQCTSSSCNNESQNFCDCPPLFEDYKIIQVNKISKTK